MFKKIKDIETSKKLLIFAGILSVIVIIASILATFILGDPSPLIALIPSVFALTSTGYGFYYWKAKSENLQKFGNNINNNIDITEEDIGGDDFNG